MTITITLPEFLAARLQSEAQAQRRSAEDLAVELLDEALETKQQADGGFHLTPEEVVAKIKALAPNPANQFAFRPAMKGLAEYLAASIASEDPNEEFDLEEWQRNWDAIEAEMRAIDRANDIAEGLH